MRHKHADIAIGWYKDTSRIVQYFWNNQWNDWNRGCDPTFNENCEWRFKPETKPDVIWYLGVDSEGWADYCSEAQDSKDNLKLTFDGETGKLIKAEVIDERQNHYPL